MKQVATCNEPKKKLKQAAEGNKRNENRQLDIDKASKQQRGKRRNIRRRGDTHTQHTYTIKYRLRALTHDNMN